MELLKNLVTDTTLVSLVCIIGWVLVIPVVLSYGYCTLIVTSIPFWIPVILVWIREFRRVETS